jgi:heme-degrading monooxygenase HmoA
MMHCTSLTIIRYPRWGVFFALCAMALLRLPLAFSKTIRFGKLMGCGRNGSFSIQPDWRQWGLLAVHTSSFENELQTLREQELVKKLYGAFIAGWLRFFGCETWTVLLEPAEGHGVWNGKELFGTLKRAATTTEGRIAVLTRATIRLRKLPRFWQHVEGVARQMASAPGYIMSVGIGEMPLIRQATFSVWESKEQMKQFAYQLREHADVVRKTRAEKWYSEDMFVRFRILHSSGTLNGKNPLH